MRYYSNQKNLEDSQAIYHNDSFSAALDECGLQDIPLKGTGLLGVTNADEMI